jgi:hypothetical protein
VSEFLSNFPNDKRVVQFSDYLLENYIDVDFTFPPAVWSECTAPSWGTINACELLHANSNALFYSEHHKIVVLVSALQEIQNETSKWEVSLHEDLKNQLHTKKENLISSKIEQYMVNLISRIEFVSSVSYKFLLNTNLYVLLHVHGSVHHHS